MITFSYKKKKNAKIPLNEFMKLFLEMIYYEHASEEILKTSFKLVLQFMFLGTNSKALIVELRNN